MESALNKAHQLERKAEKLLRNHKFDEAIACHQETAELLLEAMQLTQAAKALESIKLQRDNHLRQQGVIRYKRALIQKVSTMNKQAVKLTSDIIGARGPPNATTTATNLVKAADLQHAIYTHIEETDSLLRGLVTGRNNLPDAATTDLVRAAFKKDDKVVIEELRTNNEALRSLVERLVNELAALQRDNDDLRQQLLARELSDPLRPPRESATDDVADDSPYPAMSPFGLNSDSDQYSDDFLDVTVRELPPLEMPNFDYDSFATALDTSSTCKTVNELLRQDPHNL